MSYLQHQTSVWCSPGHQVNKLCHNVFPVPKTVKERDWLHKHKDTTRSTTAMLNELQDWQHWRKAKSPLFSIEKGYFNCTQRIKQGFKPILLWQCELAVRMSHEDPHPLTTIGASAVCTYQLMDCGSKLKMQRESKNQQRPEVVPRSFLQLCFNPNVSFEFYF